MAFAVGFADRDVAGETEAETIPEERGEGEIVGFGVAGIVRRQDAGGRIANVCCHDDSSGVEGGSAREMRKARGSRVAIAPRKVELGFSAK